MTSNISNIQVLVEWNLLHPGCTTTDVVYNLGWTEKFPILLKWHAPALAWSLANSKCLLKNANRSRRVSSLSFLLRRTISHAHEQRNFRVIFTFGTTPVVPNVKSTRKWTPLLSLACKVLDGSVECPLSVVHYIVKSCHTVAWQPSRHFSMTDSV